MSILHIGKRRVDLGCGEVEGHGALARRELALLKYFVDHRDRVIAQDELLREVWGYSPQVRTRALYTAVYRLRSLLEEDPSNPRVITAERGEGYLFTLPSDPPRADLSVEPCGCTFGRAEALARATAALAASRVVSVVGPIGVGKSRLARELAARHGAEVVWVPHGRSSLYAALAGAEAGATRRRTLDTVVRELERRAPVLVVVDGADTRDELSEQLSELLARVPGMRVLLTARSRVELPSEPAHVQLEPLDDASGAELLVARAGSCPPEQGDARALVQRVSGLPLAIEGVALMAQRLGWCATAALLGQSLARVKVVEGGRRTGIAAVVAEAWADLDVADRQQLTALLPFRGGFTLDGARAVSGADAVCGVARLRERSWVFLRDDRFYLYDIVRDLLGELVPPEALDAARIAHARWVADALATFDTSAEQDNVEAALALRIGLDDGAAAANLVHWLDQRNLPPEPMIRHLDRVVPLVEDADDRSALEVVLARTLRRAGRFSDSLEAARSAASRAVSARARLHALHQVAEAMSVTGERADCEVVERTLGALLPELTAADAAFARLTIARSITDRDPAAAVRMVDAVQAEFGSAHHRSWAYAEAIRAFAQVRLDPVRAEEHLTWLEDWHHKRGLWPHGLRSARVHLMVRQGRSAEARALLPASPAPTYAFDLLLAAWVDWLDGDADRCREGLERCAALADANRDPYTEAMALAALGQLERRLRRWGAAEALLRAAMARHVGHRPEIAAWLTAVLANEHPTEAERALASTDPSLLGARCAAWTLGRGTDLPPLPAEHELMDRIGFEVTLALRPGG